MTSIARYGTVLSIKSVPGKQPGAAPRTHANPSDFRMLLTTRIVGIHLATISTDGGAR